MRMREKHERSYDFGEERMYKIGMFAGMNHVTIKTLRYYEEQDLLHPAYIEQENGYRYYKLSQMAELSQILSYRDMGFGLDEIRAIRTGKSDINQILQRKKSTILQEIARLTEQLSKVENYMQDTDIDFSTPVIIKTLPKVICATARTVVDSYDDLFSAMPEMGKEMERLHLECADPDYCFTQYLEDVNQNDHILIETCEAVTERKEDTDLLKFQEFEEVKRAACIYHKGSYDDLYKTYRKVFSFIEKNGYEVGGYVREVYIDGIWNKETEKEWMTEIQIPLKE